MNFQMCSCFARLKSAQEKWGWKQIVRLTHCDKPVANLNWIHFLPIHVLGLGELCQHNFGHNMMHAA